MISVDNAVAFAVVSLVLIAVPGPSVLFVVGRALSLGRASAIASVVGNALGVYVVAALVAFGLGGFVQRSDTVYLAIKTAGAGYLVWLGIRAIRHRHRIVASLDASVPAVTRWQAARQGFVVGVANPKALIIFAGVLPQFVDRGRGHVPEQMLLLALIAFGIALVSDSLWALAASAVRSWFARKPRRLATVGAFGGLAMIGVGLSAAVTGRRD